MAGHWHPRRRRTHQQQQQRRCENPPASVPQNSVHSQNHPHNKNGGQHVEERRIPSTRAAVMILAGLAIMASLYFASPVVLPVLLAAVASMALKPLMRGLTNWHVPRFLAAFLILGFFMAAVGYGFASLKDPAIQWAGRIPEFKARFEHRIDNLFHHSHNAHPANPDGASAQQPNSAKPADGAGARPQPMQLQDFQGVLAWTGATLSESLEGLVLLFLLLISGDWFTDGLARVLHSKHDQMLMRETIGEIQCSITRYLFTVSIINVCLGVLVGGGLALLKFPNAALWGVMAALLNFIPYFGPIVGIIILGFVGLFSIGTFPKEIYPMAWYTVVHISEADVITPLFLGKRFTIHPVIIFVFLMFASWIWGISGALLAVPVLVSIRVICEKVPSLTPLADFMSK